MRHWGFFLGSCVAILACTIPVHAQMLGADPLTVGIFPQYPAPYETVTITPQSTLVDLATAVVTISANGTVLSKGSGSQGAAFQVGAGGAVDTIVVSIESLQGKYQKTVVIRPASVALVMEPMSTTHPFYAGANLIASEGRLRFIALPELRNAKGLLAPETLIYTWKVGNQLLTAQSGIGHSVLSATAPIRYRDTDVSLTVSAPDGSVAAHTAITVAPVDPLMVIYHSSPLAGPNFDMAIGTSFSMNGGEDAFRAVPYFFSGETAFTWSVNGEVSGSDPIITVRTTGDTPGTAALSAQASQNGSYQSGQAALAVHFGQTNGTNFFGL